MTKCYTFYSYKGGSGRSTTAVNTLRHMIEDLDASAEHPILLVDADLESAGLTYFFNCMKKFSSKFGGDSIHTTALLTNLAVYAQPSFKKALFKPSSVRTYSIRDGKPEIISIIMEIYGKNKGYDQYASFESVDNILGDIELKESELNCFKRIADVAKKQITTSSLTDDEEFVFCEYPLGTAVSTLYTIQHDNLPNKLERKQAYLRDFLPAVTFVDISEYFGLEKDSNVVKFLGADLNFKDEQPKNNNLHEVIGRIVQICNQYNFAAIIFDSGAGVQSTAHALHSVSNMMVYCMRPTKQFQLGTHNQLVNYNKTLLLAQNQRPGEEKQPIVVLLPTAVPRSNTKSYYEYKSFENIQHIVKTFGGLIDPYFCTPETALKEVEAFKWEERILLERSGTDDENDAYDVYRSLSKHLVSPGYHEKD